MKMKKSNRKMMKKKNSRTKAAAVIVVFGMAASMAAAANAARAAETSQAGMAQTEEADTIWMSSQEDGEHVIEVSGSTAEYSGLTVEKTGDSASGDEADFYGDNAAIYAEDGATLDLSDVHVNTNGLHANAVFSYGEGTTVNISDSVIETSGNCSGGLMTTGGGTMNAENLTIHTTGNSSAAIRSDRGGGTVLVTGGSYVTDGTGSPVIYSTADITVNEAELTSTASQGVVVEGKNSVTLTDCSLTAENVTKNSDKSEWYQAVMIYQSMSGDAAEGEASFTMNGGSLTNLNGDIFFVNNTVAAITLNDTQITNEDEEGVFLRAAAAGWGSEGSNGGQVTLKASSQLIEGNMIVDEVSHLNLLLDESSVFNGAINPEGQAGEVYVELSGDTLWSLTEDSYITGLTCGTENIELNGFTLYVNGEAYTEGTESTGTLIEAVVSSGKGGMSGAPDGKPGEGGHMEKPDGKPGEGGHMEKPDGKPGEDAKKSSSGEADGEKKTPPTDENGERKAPPADENGERKAPPEKPEEKTAAEESAAAGEATEEAAQETAAVEETIEETTEAQ